MPPAPSYRRLHETGELAGRVSCLEALLESCVVCPHRCGVNRLKNRRSRCHTGYLPIVSASTQHFGEEPLLGGIGGVGNIFFANCNLRCLYCQNHLISQNPREEAHREIDFGALADVMLDLQEKGCHSIGLVSPSHVVPQIVRAVDLAAGRGLTLPLVYNTSAYDSVDVLRLLDGIVDIYLPDLKYADEDLAKLYSGVDDYPRIARTAIEEMEKQVGTELIVDEEGLLRRGLIIRHLVLPNDIAGSKETLRWIRGRFGPRVTLSLMAQYAPAHRARLLPLLNRTVRRGEYERVIDFLGRLEMEEGWAQEFESASYYLPEFQNRDRPFRGKADNRE